MVRTGHIQWSANRPGNPASHLRGHTSARSPDKRPIGTCSSRADILISTLTAAAARAPAGAPDRVWARLGMRSSARPLWSHTHELVRTAPKINTTHRPEADSTASAGSACPDDAEPGGEARLLPERPVRMTQSRNQETGTFVADSFCRICRYQLRSYLAWHQKRSHARSRLWLAQNVEERDSVDDSHSVADVMARRFALGTCAWLYV